MSFPVPAAASSAVEGLSWLERLERDVVHLVTCTWRGEPLETLCRAVESKALPVVLLLALTAWVAARQGRVAVRVLLTAAAAWGLSMLLADLLWATVRRPRPTEVLAPLLRTPEEQAACASLPSALALHSAGSTSPAFPSRHALTVGVFVTALALARRRLGLVAALYGALVCLQRLYSGKHWPSDLLAGLLLGAGVAWLTWRALPGAAQRLGLAWLLRAPEPPAAPPGGPG